MRITKNILRTVYKHIESDTQRKYNRGELTLWEIRQFSFTDEKENCKKKFIQVFVHEIKILKIKMLVSMGSEHQLVTNELNQNHMSDPYSSPFIK